jgi:hypothetical protein
VPTKKPIGQLDQKEAVIDTHTVIRPSAPETAIARAGRSVTKRAVAGGPIMRLKTSKAPTTGSAIVVTTPTARRNNSSMRAGLTPRTDASSGAIELSIN